MNRPVCELTRDRFSPYGAFAAMIDPAGVKIGAEPVEFFRDMVQVDLGGATSVSCSVCRVQPRPLVIEVTEFHSRCGEGILPLNGDVLIHVGPATPNGTVPMDEIEIFRVPQGTLVSLRPGVWHHAPFALKTMAVDVLILLPERAYANNCTVFEVPAPSRIGISKETRNT